MSWASEAFGLDGGGIDTPDQADINKSKRSVRNFTLGRHGERTSNPLLDQAMSYLNNFFSYDPMANMSTGTGQIQGTGPSAILDAMARQSYQTASGAINEQANQGLDRISDQLASRGILRSSETPQAMGTMEGQRINAIQRAAGGIEQNRLAGQMQMPGMAMQMGQFGQGEAQRQFGNRMGIYNTAMNQTFGMAQLEAQAQQQQAQQDQMQMDSLMGLGQNIGALAAAPFTGGASLAMLGQGQNSGGQTNPQSTPSWLWGNNFGFQGPT